MEKDVSLGPVGDLDFSFSGGNLVMKLTLAGGIAVNTTQVGAVAALKALNAALDAKFPGAKLITDEAFTLLEAGVSAVQ